MIQTFQSLEDEPGCTEDEETMTVIRIKQLNEDEQIAYGVVYEPGVLDTDGEFMTPEDVALMEERFRRKMQAGQDVIDRMHDNVPVDAEPLDSFVSDGTDGWPEGAWVLGIKVNDPAIWDDIKSGRLNGYSFEAATKRVPVVIEVEMEQDVIGETEVALDHTHLYFVSMTDDGRVASGITSTDLGHSHKIKSGTATEESLGHAHRFVL